MKKNTHTPGPWEVIDKNGYEIHGTTRRGQKIIVARITDEPSAVSEDANARLIAAAPELLEALEAARDELQVVTQELYGEDYNSPQINAAITKARGQS